MPRIMKRRLVLLVLTALALLPLACAADQNLQARFEKSLKDAKDISNVEIKWIDTLWIGDPESVKLLDANAKEFSRTFEYSFTAAGPKFRSTCKLVSGTETNLVKLMEAAFDGSKYVTYMGNNRHMSKSSTTSRAGNAETDLNPLTAPFMFLSKNGDDCPLCLLRSTDLASNGFGNGITLPAGQTAGDQIEFSLAGARNFKQDTTWVVSLDKEGDAFTPRTIQLILPATTNTIVRTLLDYTNLGAYQFPTRIAWTLSPFPPTSPPTVQMTGMVTVVSARIPEQIADSVFKLDSEEKSAAVVWDWDKKGFTKSPPRPANLQTLCTILKKRRVWWFAILVPVAIVAAIIAKKVAAQRRSV